MAPMDKYTRLVGGAVHGLSCFHSGGSALCFFFFLPPLLIKPGNKESGIKHAWVLDAIAPHCGQLIW